MFRVTGFRFIGTRNAKPVITLDARNFHHRRAFQYSVTMHIRFSAARGTQFVEEGHEEGIGWLSDILIHPDTGVVEGFFVQVPLTFSNTILFCTSLDILRWGVSISVRDRNVLSIASDRIRLRPLLEDGRTVLGQRMQMQSGRCIGRCRDVQFNSDTFKLEWLFPRKYFRFGTAVPISEVIEVTGRAIILRDPRAESTEPILEGKKELSLDPLKEIAQPRPSRVIKSASEERRFYSQ